jgi:hypothetical protein
MSQSKPAPYELFLKRYEQLKALYFSPLAMRQPVDEEGEPIPSCFMSQAQIANTFLTELKVQVPVHRQDPPRFLDGTVGPSLSQVRRSPAPPTPLEKNNDGYMSVDRDEAMKQNWDSIQEMARPSHPRPKMIHCSTHGKVLAIMMDDDVLMCETCYHQSLEKKEVKEDEIHL